MQPQITIEGLSIQGIRSFAPVGEAPEQRISFKGRLTILLGPNGAGKSTIIECLRNATTGEVPGTGKSWLHSPSLAGQTVQARIRLVLTRTVHATADSEGECALYRIERSFKQALSPSGDGAFNRQPVAIYRKDRHSASAPLVPYGTARDLASSEQQVAELVGVPPDLLKHVLFCPQEESLWPLEVSSRVQRRLDAIFGCARVTAAVVALRDVVKQYGSRTEVASALATERERLLARNKLAAETVTKRAELGELDAQRRRAERELVSAETQRRVYDSATEFAHELGGDVTRRAALLDAFNKSAAALPTDTRRAVDLSDSDPARSLEVAQGDLAKLRAQLSSSPRRPNISVEEASAAVARTSATLAQHESARRHAVTSVAALSKRYLSGGLAVSNVGASDDRALAEALAACEKGVMDVVSCSRSADATAESELAIVERCASEAAAAVQSKRAQVADLRSTAARLRREGADAAKSLVEAEDAARGVVCSIRDAVADMSSEEKADATSTSGPLKRTRDDSGVGAVPWSKRATSAGPSGGGTDLSTLLEQLRGLQLIRRKKCDADVVASSRWVRVLKSRWGVIVSAGKAAQSRLEKQRVAAAATAAEGATRETVRTIVGGARAGARMPPASEWFSKVQAKVEGCRRALASASADVAKHRGSHLGLEAHVAKLRRSLLSEGFVESDIVQIEDAARNAARVGGDGAAAEDASSGDVALGQVERAAESAAQAAFDTLPSVVQARGKAAAAQRRLHALAGNCALLEAYLNHGVEKGECPTCVRPMAPHEVAEFSETMNQRIQDARTSEAKLMGTCAGGNEGDRGSRSVDSQRDLVRLFGRAVGAALRNEAALSEALSVESRARGGCDAVEIAAQSHGGVDEFLVSLARLRELVSQRDAHVEPNDAVDSGCVARSAVLDGEDATEVIRLSDSAIAPYGILEIDTANVTADELDAADAAVTAALAAAERKAAAAADASAAALEAEAREARLVEPLILGEKRRDTAASLLRQATDAEDRARAADEELSALEAAAADAQSRATAARGTHSREASARREAQVAAEADLRTLRGLWSSDKSVALAHARRAASDALASETHAKLLQKERAVERFVDVASQLAAVTDRSRDAAAALQAKYPSVRVTVAPGETLSEAVSKAARVAADVELTCRGLKERLDGKVELLRSFLDDNEKSLRSLRGVRAKAVATAVKLAAMDALCADLSALEKKVSDAIAAYHTTKLEHVNTILRELWTHTYRSHDVKAVELVAERDRSSPSGEGGYSYRVVMSMRDAPSSHRLDMRTRCSAGQKMLVCLLVRLALAEAFGGSLGMVALDEPTTNMDAANARALGHALATLLSQRVDRLQRVHLVVITHDENFVGTLAGATGVDEMYFVRKMKAGGARYPISVVEQSHVPQGVE